MDPSACSCIATEGTILESASGGRRRTEKKRRFIGLTLPNWSLAMATKFTGVLRTAVRSPETSTEIAAASSGRTQKLNGVDPTAVPFSIKLRQYSPTIHKGHEVILSDQ
mmetsp:Transcript_4192/g.9093  ORF Transcript_4192/g.9093 Transcript_4192/m.9093 type:complete len:109 (-) Transcript_4192:269-595(-)